jgi:hypothetical protein
MTSEPGAPSVVSFPVVEDPEVNECIAHQGGHQWKSRKS